jgi:mono/diheme cytochrome c family protein
MGNWRATSRPAHPTGFGVWDAVNILMNTINATALHNPSNYRVPQMPVSYPSIWLTDQSDRLLWNAAVSSVTLRQVGEVIIVFGRADVSRNGDKFDFETSADLQSLREVYKYTDKLAPPKWPEDVLGQLDPQKVARGAELYTQQGCVKCHANQPPYPRSEPNALGNRYIKTYPTSIQEVKTDPTYAEVFVQRTAKPGLFAPAFKGTVFEGQQDVPAAILFLATLTALTEADLAKTAKTEEERQALLGGRPLPQLPKSQQELDALVQSLLVYKAAPLPGIWASAPYLHNASVPNLYELLLPADQRSQSFTLGNRQFDPQRVGYETEGGGYRYDTTLPAYSNRGHEYGTTLPDADRWALVEYLKSL